MQLFVHNRPKRNYFFAALLTVLVMGFGVNGQGQILTENFEEPTTTSTTGGTGMPGSFSTGSYLLTSGTWVFKDAKRGTTNFSSGIASCQLNNATGANIISPNIASGGVGTINFTASVSTANGTALQVATTTDGINFTQIPGSPFTLATTPAQFSVMTNDTNANVRVRFYRTGSFVFLDDISFTAVSAPVPTITSLSPSSVVYNSGAQTLTINGTNFLNGITTATYKGIAKAVTYISSTQIAIPLSAGDVKTVGTFPVVVNNRGNAATASAPFTVVKANQTITFGALPAKTTSDTLFNPGATATSALPVTYTSSNTSVATITTDGLVNITGIGTTVITALQAGDANYNAATPVSQTLTVIQGPVLIAGWDFQTTTTGGIQIKAIPNTQKFYPANFGAGNIYLDGTNGSSNWNVTSAIATTELNAFAGTAVNAGPGFAGATAPNTVGSLALVSGNGTSANGKSMVVKFSMSGRKNLLVSYATQGTASGFTSQKWEYSKDGITWITAQTITAIPVFPPATFITDTLVTITGLDTAATAYLKLTVNGATSGGANNRLDNIRLIASAAPAITSQPVNAPAYCAGTAGTDTFTVAASGYPVPAYQWQYSKNNIIFKNVIDNTPAGFTYVNANTAKLTVNTSASAVADTSFYRAVVTNSIDSTVSNSALLLNGLPVAAVAVSPKDVCSGSTDTIRITGTPGAVVTYNVYVDGFLVYPNQSGTINSSGSFTTTTILTGRLTYRILITNIFNPATGCNNTTNSSTTGNVYPLPTPDFLVSPPSSVCLNTEYTYTTQANDTLYVWTVPGTKGTDYNISKGGLGPKSRTVTLIWLTTGSKTVTVNYTNGNGCSGANPAKSTVTVTTPPTANIGDFNPILCSGSKADIQVLGTPAATINYSASDGTTGSFVLGSDGTYLFHSNAIIATGTSSTYTFTITGVTSSNSCSGSAVSPKSVAITVYANPVVASISGGEAYIGVDSTTKLTDATSSGKWSSDNNNIAAIDTAGVVKGIAAGTDSIRYTVTGNGGCTSSAVTAIHVYSQLVANFRTAKGGAFSSVATWEYAKGNGSYLPATFIPSPSNSIEVTQKLLLDVDDTIGTGKSFLLNTTVATDTFVVAPGRVFTVFGAANFNGKNVLLRSTKDSTAQIGGTAIISNATQVTAERFIALNNKGGDRTGRSWRLLTSPISNALIHDAWQEDTLTNTNLAPQNPAPGYGTNITGTRQGTSANANNNGYDFWPAIANTYSSIRSYSGTPTGGTWADIPSIKGMKISAQPAYILFVRGDRSQFSPPMAGSTNLRATGLLRQNDTTYTVASSQGFSLIGNPYAAVLDFDKILNNNSTLIKPQYWRWDANNGTYGGYTLVQKNSGSYYTVPYPFDGTDKALSINARYIASGQGFFVEPLNAGTGGFLNISRTDKVTAGISASPFRVMQPPPSRLFVNLNLYSETDSSSSIADGVMAAFDDNTSNSDVRKPYNFDENLGLDKDTSILTVLSHPAQVTIMDTLHLRLWNTTQRSYQIQVKTENWQPSGLQAYLLDNYLHTTSPLSLSGEVSTINFTISSDAASAVQHRFSIVFSSAVLPVTITKVTAYKKSDGSVQIDWQTANETNMREYTVERSFNGRDFTAVSTAAAGSPSGSYSITDSKPGSSDNYYRIRIESASGEVTFSAVVRVSFSTTGSKTLITLFPNPVQESVTAYLKVENLTAGTYNAALYSASGQRIQVSVITHSGGSAVISYPLPHLLAQGRYTLRLFNSDKKQITTLPVVVVKK